ncbi:peptidase S41 [Tamlana nanhaiensis]|uniref:Peptidase S41 n=1 Tax=Neotamlana nanhaiensis TaxID=1382798 RepID=A0A0D7W5K1_9FLAO|nr:S41 family peptidase [Tamlana nanhaiensis]KJD33107.1 peptidase S41 [Tamlana nanhaiensis]
MKYSVVFIVIGLVFSSCTSVKKYNDQIAQFHTVEALKLDVDKLYNQLKKHHPNLYQYTSKEVLDFKFDSLKSTITKPLNTNAFYKKIAPVLAQVKQGHVGLGYTVRRFTKKERKALKKQKLDFYDLEFEFLDDRLWVKNNFGKDSTLIGTEVIKIEDDSVLKLIENYKTLFASDGFNTTLYNRFVAKGFPVYYTRDKGFLDSLSVTFKQHDSVFVKQFKRIKKDKDEDEEIATADSLSAKNEKPKKLSKAEKQKQRLAKKRTKKYNKKHGFIAKRKQYTRNFNFIGKDTSVAYMKIRSFTNGNYKKFYNEVFTKLDSAKTKNLVIDLRDNGGGRIAEIDYLYGFLTKTNYQFLNPSEVNSRIPFLKSFMTNATPNSAKLIGGILSPFVVLHNVFKIKKENGKLYYNFNKQTKIKPPKLLHFKGEIYVLINGNSFSASSLLSTHLKATKRAMFVGEETGGAYNGCVAGIYKIYSLPTSKVRVRMGMMQIEAPQKQNPDGYGVKPDVEVLPTVEDFQENCDPELEWVLNHINSSKKP